MNYNNFLVSKTILIVEDDLSSRLYLNKVLENTGAALLNAFDGQEAIDITRQNRDVDLILMDIQLPLIDGYQASETIRTFRKDIVIIAQTAYGLHGDTERLVNSGFNDFIIKPIMPKLLFEKICACLAIADN
jgi:CheY-like chemotaxis protein